MIRHDVPDDSYRELASRLPFAAGNVTVLDARGNFGGVLVGGRHVLTAGHPIVGYLEEAAPHGAINVSVIISGQEYRVDYAHLHPSYDHQTHYGGADLALLRIAGDRASGTPPARIWVGGIKLGEMFIGIGRGRTGTGLDNNEPGLDGTFRGYENKIGYIFPDEGFRHFRSCFDNGSQSSNTLARVLYGPNKSIAGMNCAVPCPLEGTIAAGDSGSGVWVARMGAWYVAGIASYRYYSTYGGQAGYVNLSHPTTVAWLQVLAASGLDEIHLVEE